MKRTALAGWIAALGWLGAAIVAALSPSTVSLATVSFAQGYDDAAGRTAAKSIPEPTDPVLRDRERKVLMIFYNALGGTDWIERDFWGSDRPVGQWHGVRTDADGRVVQLTIYDNNLAGELPAAICQLERLATLYLSFNKISGALPNGLGHCRALRNLWVKGNKLTGRLPDSVATLPALEYLDVHANDLSGPLPAVWDAPKLKIFRAEDNRISGALPAPLLRQPALEQVFLHNNEFTGAIPTTLGPNLRALLLTNNRLSGRIPAELGQLKKLTDLRLNRNELTGPIPASLASASIWPRCWLASRARSPTTHALPR